MVDSRYVHTWKLDTDGNRIPKTRIVAKGFQDSDSDHLVIDCPTISKISLRLCYQLCTNRNWTLNKIDLKTAFLQGKSFSSDRAVFVKPPVDAAKLLGIDTSKRYLWLLKKSVYGLKDAPRAWFLRLSSFFRGIGLTASQTDPALFLYNSNGQIEGCILTYVDDLKILGTSSFLDMVISSLNNEFKIGSHEKCSFRYCGIDISSIVDSSETITQITLSQKSYIDSLIEIPVPKIDKTTPLSEDLYQHFRRLLGNLSWLSNNTRIDIAFRVNQLSISQNCPTIYDAICLNKLVRYVKNNNLEISFPKQIDENMKLLVFADSSFGNNTDKSSQTGYILALGTEISPNEYVYSIIDWKSVKQRRVCTSTTSAESNALVTALNNCHFVKRLISEMFGLKGISVLVFSDSKNIVNLCLSQKGPSANTDKMAYLNTSSIRQQLEFNEISSISHIQTHLLIADALTKHDPSSVNRLVASVRSKLVRTRVPDCAFAYSLMVHDRRITPGERMLCQQMVRTYQEIGQHEGLTESSLEAKSGLKELMANDAEYRKSTDNNPLTASFKYRKDRDEGFGHHSSKHRFRNRSRFKTFTTDLIREHREHVETTGEKMSYGHFLGNRRKDRVYQRRNEMITLPEEHKITLPSQTVSDEHNSKHFVSVPAQSFAVSNARNSDSTVSNHRLKRANRNRDRIKNKKSKK